MIVATAILKSQSIATSQSHGWTYRHEIWHADAV